MADDDLILLRRHSFSHPKAPKPTCPANQAPCPRRFSTVATCHRPDRVVVDTEPNLDNVLTPGARQVLTNYIPNPIAFPGLVTAPRQYHHQPETLPVEISQSLLSRSLHRTVVIANLPRKLTDTRDVLCRVRCCGGGPLAHCFLTTGPGSSGARERLFVLTFGKSADAQRYYAHFVLQDSTRHHQATWSFPPNPDDNEKSYAQDEQIAQIQYHTDLAKLGLHFDTDPADAPLAPWANKATGIPGATTRCLVAKACPVFMIERVLRELRLLPFLPRSPHFRSQVEDIWLDNFGCDDEPADRDAQQQQQRSRSGAFCDLHIWFTNTNAAMTTLNGCRFGLGAKLRCEPDPCAGQQQHQHIWHSHGNISLLTLSDHGMLDSVFQGWRKVRMASHVASTAARIQCCAGPSGPGDCSVGCEGLVGGGKQTADTRSNTNKVAVDQTSYTIPDLIQSAGGAVLAHSAVKPAVISPLPQNVTAFPTPATPLIQHDQMDHAGAAGESGPELSHKANTSNLLSSSRAEANHIRRDPPAPTSPTYLSVLYNAALEAYRRSPTSRDLSTSFQIPASAIEVLGDVDVNAINQKGPFNASADATDPSLDSSADNSSSRSSSEPSPTGAGATEQNEQQQQKYFPVSLVSWTCDMDEFMAMSDEQWMAFGTVFYRPPPGFDTTKRHGSTIFERVE